MNKAELRQRLCAGEMLDDLFPFSPGQECEIVKADDFYPGSEIIYIPDCPHNGIPTARPAADAEEIEDILNHCYTGDDFIALCGGDVQKAKYLFCYCDWQNPSSAVDEIDSDDEKEFDMSCEKENALTEIETLRDRDMLLESLWDQFSDIPMDPKTECIEKPFLGWEAGVPREEIWHWFDRRYSKGVAHLLYGKGVDRTDQLLKLMYLKQFCIECESAACQYNHGGECRFALVHERKPQITDLDGCIDYDFSEGDC